MRDALHKKISVTFVAISFTSHNHTQNSHTQTHMYRIKHYFYLIGHLMPTSPLATNTIFSGLFNLCPTYFVYQFIPLCFFPQCSHFLLTLGRWCTFSLPALRSQEPCRQFADFCSDIPFTLGIS